MGKTKDLCGCGSSKDFRSATCRTCFDKMQDGITEKTCTGCEKTKPIGEFGKRPGGRPRARCRTCESTYAREHKRTDAEHHAAVKAQWAKDNPERVRKSALRTRAKLLGLDPDLIERHFDEHHGRCDICDRPPFGRSERRLSIDHDHATGSFRGLLCSECNLGLGKFGDDPKRLIQAAKYLS